MDAHTLDLLELGKIKELVAGYATSSLGRELAAALQPLHDEDTIRRSLEETSEMVEALDARMQPPTGGLRDLRQPVKRAALGVLLEVDQLGDLHDLFDLTGRCFDYALRLGPDYPRLAALLQNIQDQRHLAHAVGAVVDPQGKIRDSADPELAKIRREIESYEEKIQAELRRLLRQPVIREALRYPNATVSGDHHVLPVAVNHRHKVAGVVHRTSSSGETIFIEPARVAELSAEVAVLRGAEKRAIRKILRRLTTRIAQESEQILKSLEALAQIDLLQAKARYSCDFQMSAADVSSRPHLRLAAARHPLLLHLFRKQSSEKPKDAQTPNAEVVPITVELGHQYDMLVVTGPNTGGKTVALKTIGLLCVMTQAGLHIPAQAGSKVPLLADVLADIGDEQSLEQSLSTFSAHVTRIRQILAECSKQTLVLLDELGAGTDPSEGAALGRAILDDLVENKCLGIVTTHLGDLKSYAFHSDRVENAAVEFDVATLRPTYRMIVGQYGESCALRIARRLKLPRDLVQRAFKYLRRRKERGSGSMKAVQDMRHKAEQARLEALQAEDQARKAEADYQKKAKLLEQEAAIREQLEKFRTSLKPGDAVRVSRFEKTGTVRRIDRRRQQAAVTVGAVEWELALEELMPCLPVDPNESLSSG